MSKAIYHAFFRTALAALLLAAFCTAEAASVQNDTLPMYGQPATARSKKLQEADDAYIQQATDQAGGDRKAAAATALDAAEQAMSQSNADEAMRNYNHAWLLNPNDFQAFWGFGRIEIMHDSLDNAIKHLDKAVELVTDPDFKPLVLADAGIAYSMKASHAQNDKKLFAKANDLFQQSTTLSADFAVGWLRWSQSLYREAKYADAWVKVKKAEEVGGQVPKGYLRSLSEKMPEPK